MSSERMHAVPVNQDGAPRAGRELRYQRVYDLVTGLIADQGLEAGAKLPSTAELSAMAEVSVISVRRALDELAHDGIIVRHQGVGTFVAQRRLVSQPGSPGTLLGTISDGISPVEFSTELVGIAVGLPGPDHVRALGIESGQPVWEIARVRSRGGVRAVAELATIPLSLAPALDEDRLAAGESLYGLIEERAGITEAYAEQFFQVDRPTAWEREQLDIGADDTVMRVRGVSYSDDDVPFDSYLQTYRADDFVFYVSGKRGPRLLPPPTGAGRWDVRPFGAPSAD